MSTFRKITINKADIETTIERAVKLVEPKLVSYLIETEKEHHYTIFVYFQPFGQLWYKIPFDLYKNDRPAYNQLVQVLAEKNRALNKHATFVRSGIGEFGDDKQKGNITFRLYYKFSIDGSK